MLDDPRSTQHSYSCSPSVTRSRKRESDWLCDLAASETLPEPISFSLRLGSRTSSRQIFSFFHLIEILALVINPADIREDSSYPQLTAVRA